LTSASRQGLWRDPDFLKLWAGQTVSALGTMFGALSLTALVYLHATPAQMGLLAAAGGIPVLLFSLFAGVWVDRVPRQGLMVAADLGRFGLLLTVPAAAAIGELRVEQLYAVAFGVSVLQLGFDLAYRAYLPTLVDRHRLFEANSRLQASEAVTEVGSPAIGGGLVQALGGPAAVLVDAITFLCSAVSVALIRKRERRPPRRPAQREGVVAEVREGLAVVWRSRVLRALAGASGTFSFFGGFYAALYPVFVIGTLGFSPVVMGVTVGAGGVGSVFGALVAGPMARRLGFGRTLVASRMVYSAAGLLIPLAGGPKEVAFAMIVASQLLGDPFWTTYDIASLSLRQSLTPEDLLGRVNSSMHVVQAGLLPLGSLLAGLLAETIGVRETLALAVAGGAAGTAWLLASPIPGLRQPAADEAVLEVVDS
jgi:MFS family permease